MLGIGNRQFGILPRGYALGAGVPAAAIVFNGRKIQINGQVITLRGVK